MHARRNEGGDEDTADRSCAARRTRDRNVDPPSEECRERDENDARLCDDAGDGLDEVTVALRKFHDKREAHDRTDDGHERAVHHRLAERRDGVARNAADEAHEQTCGEEYHARLILLDDGGKGDDDNNSSCKSQ